MYALNPQRGSRVAARPGLNYLSWRGTGPWKKRRNAGGIKSSPA